MELVINTLITNLVELVAAVALALVTGLLTPWLVNTAIPWLKEKRLYNLAAKFVAAAEKRAEAGTIDKAAKKQFVIELFTKKGIEITAELDAFIEAAVKELDIFTQETIAELGTVFEVEEETVAEPEPNGPPDAQPEEKY